MKTNTQNTSRKMGLRLPWMTWQGAMAVACLVGTMVSPSHAMTTLDDVELSAVNGQALLVVERFAGSGSGAGYIFTRMGLDAELALNANINKLQLGCGGFNEYIRSNACDIDFDYVSLMGRNGSQAGAVGSDFKMTRPYIEIATKGSGSTEELVGFRLGSQFTDGYFGVGRVYNDGETNLENGGVCDHASAVLNCHSGINSISTYMNVDMAGRLNITTSLGNGTACFGRIAGSNPDCSNNAPVLKEFIGTRMQSVVAESIPLTLGNNAIFNVLTALGLGGYTQMDESLRITHGFAFEGTSDFFLSFQREKITYPNYDKTTYAKPANAGWWMNIPSLRLEAPNVAATNVDGLGGLVKALSEPGYPVKDVELNQMPPDNCFGSTRFC